MLHDIPLFVSSYGRPAVAVIGLALAGFGARRYGRKLEQQTQARPNYPKS